MTVKRLIEILQTHEQSAVVTVQVSTEESPLDIIDATVEVIYDVNGMPVDTRHVVTLL